MLSETGPKVEGKEAAAAKAMMSMGKGLRLGMCSIGKRKRSNNYADNKEAIGLSKGGKQQQVKRSKRNELSKKNAVATSRGFSLVRCSTAKNKAKEEIKQLTRVIQAGDRVDLSQLLFTKHRDHLITYNDRDRPVQAKHLEGKVIVLHFLPIFPWSYDDYSMFGTTTLLEIYNALHPQGNLEVVFVGVQVDHDVFGTKVLHSNLENYFEQQFSFMPWTAIPFSDTKSRKYLETRFPVSDYVNFKSVSVVIDPTGMVLQCQALSTFEMYGARGYPFSQERIECLISEDIEALDHPSISKLLASPERDYVINNNMQKVPLHTLDDKVVALYFFGEVADDDFITEIRKAYKQLVEEKNFEIVLVYIHDEFLTYDRSTEELFWERFSNMPWLALPYKDPTCKKLQRVFNYPGPPDGLGPDPRLVIIGPNGKFVEHYGADIFTKFGLSAYPFTRKKIVKIEAGKIKKLKLKLDMFCRPNTSFIQSDGSKVPLSQLVGKKIILIAEYNSTIPNSDKFWQMLQTKYFEMKGTKNEFIVIHICEKQISSYINNVAPMSGLRLPVPTGTDEQALLSRVFWRDFGLLAFDSDGMLVRRTVFPSIKKDILDFPFHAGSLEKEVLRELKYRFEWDMS